MGFFVSQYSQKHIFKTSAFHTFTASAIFTPVISTPAIWCHDFHSSVFHYRDLSIPFYGTVWQTSVPLLKVAETMHMSVMTTNVNIYTGSWFNVKRGSGYPESLKYGSLKPFGGSGAMPRGPHWEA